LNYKKVYRFFWQKDSTNVNDGRGCRGCVIKKNNGKKMIIIMMAKHRLCYKKTNFFVDAM
jgi:hypothetical protein